MKVARIRHPRVMQVLDPAVSRLVDTTVVMGVGEMLRKSQQAQKKPEDRTAADWNRILQAQAKRQRRRERRRQQG